MIVGDLIYNDDFNIDCDFEVYDCRIAENWQTAPLLFSTLINGGHKPLDSILDMRIKLITICESRIIVEADN